MIAHLRGIDRERQEEGQIIPALLLVVVALIFFGLLFVQVGSAAEQKTQTQTAADSAAVASAHAMRDFGIVTAGWTMAFDYGFLFKVVAVPPNPNLETTACDAAQRNWTANPHGSGLDCGQLAAFPTGGGVRVDLTAPPGEVTTGPAQAQHERATAAATAKVVLGHCPQLATPQQTAIAHYLIFTALAGLGSSDGGCYTPADGTYLGHLNSEPWEWSGFGPPQAIYDAVRDGMRTELTDD